MTNLSPLRLRRMFNTRSERFRRWLMRYLTSPDGERAVLTPSSLHILFQRWAAIYDPSALKDNETAPKLMMV